MITANLIGNGNLGTHLFHALDKCDNITVNQWIIRSEKKNKKTTSGVEVISDIKNLEPTDVTIIAVNDDHIKEVSEAIPFENSLVVHTSGSVSVHDLDQKHKRGVFYPLQSFSKDADLDFSKVPICIEALAKEDFKTLKELSSALGCQWYKINTEQRQHLHLAAVYVNNFVNHLYRIGHEIVDAKSINFDILKPLIMETAKKVQGMSPYQAQTGPAVRSDKKTIKRHKKLLEDELHEEIYELLTKAIQQTHGR